MPQVLRNPSRQLMRLLLSYGMSVLVIGAVMYVLTPHIPVAPPRYASHSQQLNNAQVHPLPTFISASWDAL